MPNFITPFPVLNATQKVFGYSLLTDLKAKEEGENADSAASSALLESFHSIGVERLTGGKRAFLYFPPGFILNQMPTLFSNKTVIVDNSYPFEPTDQMLAALKALKDKGYSLSFGSYIFTAAYQNFLPLANYVNINFIHTPFNIVEQLAIKNQGANFNLLASGISKREDFETAKKLGFNLFTGFFFCEPVESRPEPAGKTVLAPNKAICVNLVKLAFDHNVNFDKMADVIKRDVALSYQLLRVVNSAYFAAKYTIKNIRQALAILGMDEVRKWVTLISLLELSSDKPSELLRLSLIRARLMEIMAPHLGLKNEADDAFMVGIISLMDVITDTSFDYIAEETNLSKSIFAALTGEGGAMSSLLTLAIKYERGEWIDVAKLCYELKVSPDVLAKSHVEAIEWANQL